MSESCFSSHSHFCSQQQPPSKQRICESTTCCSCLFDKKPSDAFFFFYPLDCRETLISLISNTFLNSRLTDRFFCINFEGFHFIISLHLWREDRTQVLIGISLESAQVGFRSTMLLILCLPGHMIKVTAISVTALFPFTIACFLSFLFFF